MEQWKSFEKRIKEETLLLGHAITQIPSHLQRARGGISFRKKTDCDFAASIGGLAVFFDAKVCGEGRFNIKSLLLREKKAHQYEFLKTCVDRGAYAGYLIWFYRSGSIVWLDASKIGSIEGASITPDSVELVKQSDSEPINLKKLLGVK